MYQSLLRVDESQYCKNCASKMKDAYSFKRGKVKKTNFLHRYSWRAVAKALKEKYPMMNISVDGD